MSVPTTEQNPTPAYQQPVDAVIAALGSDGRCGLSEAEARTRLERDGRNELTAEEPVPGWKKLLAQFRDVLVIFATGDGVLAQLRQEQRDTHLRSADFFDAEKWPTIRFVGKRFEGDVSGDFTLYGDITIRDVTRELKLDVTNEGTVRDPWGNSRVGFSAKGKLDRRDFGLLYNQVLEAGGFVVGDEVKLSVDAEFTAVTADAAAAA